jgi:hygromycin-B 7''-O-kinase
VILFQKPLFPHRKNEKSMAINIISSDEELQIYRNNMPFLKPIIDTILSRENIQFQNISLFKTGSSIIIDIDNKFVLKIYPNFMKEDYEREHSSLTLLYKNKIQNVPQLYLSGKIDHYYYVITNKIDGINLESIWNKINIKNKISIMSNIGKFLKSIHTIQIKNYTTKHEIWHTFLENQIKNCKKYHEKNGSPSFLLPQVENFIEKHIQRKLKTQNICFLSGDIHYWNILVKEEQGQYTISGYIDYGDAFYGESEYDFLAPAYFMANEDPVLLKALFLSYGYSEKELNTEFSHRMFAFQLIHRFSKIKNNNSINDIYKLAEATWNFS